MSAIQPGVAFVDPRLGRFSIEAVLGSGAMGRVLLVHDQWGEEHALKVPTRLSRQLVSRLRREAQVLTRLNHPHIVSARGVVDVFGRPGLLMERVDGPDLGTLLTRYELDIQQVDTLARGILAGLGAAHAQGVVHRDIKPANVLISLSGPQPVPKLSDFGLVKFDADTRSLTGTGVMMGTHGYMAPEQIRDAKRADTRSDVFSAGVLLYTMATGTEPFAGDTGSAVLAAVLDGDFAPLSQTCPELGSARIDAIHRALQRNPAERFPDAVAFAAAWPDEPLGTASFISLPNFSPVSAESHTLPSFSVPRETLHTDLPASKTLPPSITGDAPADTTCTLELELGDRLGGFTVVGHIGRGGMGDVWEAEQHHPRRRVALKTIHPERLTHANRERFRREAQLLGQLLHPGIPQVYAAGEDQGRLFIAMEKVDGETLDTRALRLPDRTARLRLLIAVCDAVQHAHLRGILHRDLKPANIMVDRTGQPKVLDFGIAQPTHSAALPVAGTPAYMSPEQFAGDPLDVRSDVYSLGVVAFELLTGHRPSLEHPSPAHHDPELAGDVDAILLRATASLPEDRYASAHDLAADLSRHLDYIPVHARPATPRYVATRWLQRNRVLSAAAATVMLSLLGTSIGGVWSAVRVNRALVSEQQMRAEAELAQIRAEEQRDAAESVRDFLVGVLEQAHPDENHGRDITVRKALMGATGNIVDGELHRAPAADVAVRHTLIDALRAIDAHGLARDVGEGLMDRLDTGPYTWELFQGLIEFVPTIRRAQPKRAAALLDRLDTLTEQLDPSTPERVGWIRSHTALQRAAILRDQRQFAAAIPRYEAAIALANAPDLPAMRAEYADVLCILGKVTQARALYEEAWRDSRARHGENHSTTLLHATRLGQTQVLTGDVEAGFALIEQVVETRTAVLGPSHRRTTAVRTKLCRLRAQLAIDDGLQQCIDDHARHLTHAQLVHARASLALAQGDLDAAAHWLQEPWVRSSVHTWLDRALRAELLWRQGDSVQARAMLDEAQAELETYEIGPRSAHAYRVHHLLRQLDAEDGTTDGASASGTPDRPAGG